MAHYADQPLPAIVIYVHNDYAVNLCVFDANGVPHGRSSVVLVQPGQPAPHAGYCEWMPYQKSQAAKTEALAETLAFTQRRMEENTGLNENTGGIHDNPEI